MEPSSLAGEQESFFCGSPLHTLAKNLENENVSIGRYDKVASNQALIGHARKAWFEAKDKESLSKTIKDGYSFKESGHAWLQKFSRTIMKQNPPKS